MPQTPFVLLVNPWICDFAAHDLWAKPLGLLQIGSLLRAGGYRVGFIDCLDRHDPETNRRTDMLPPTFRPFGTGKFPKVPLETPEPKSSAFCPGVCWEPAPWAGTRRRTF